MSYRFCLHCPVEFPCCAFLGFLHSCFLCRNKTSYRAEQGSPWITLTWDSKLKSWLQTWSLRHFVLFAEWHKYFNQFPNLILNVLTSVKCPNADRLYISIAATYTRTYGFKKKMLYTVKFYLKRCSWDNCVRSLQFLCFGTVRDKNVSNMGQCSGLIQFSSIQFLFL